MTAEPRQRVLRSALFTALAVLLLAALAVTGWLVAAQRARGGGVNLAPPAAVPSPSVGTSQSPAPKHDQWTVARARRKVPVYAEPRNGAGIKTYLPAKTRYGVDTVMLVREVCEVDGRLWYNVWLPQPPNGSRGWITPRQVALYNVHSQIRLDVTKRVLYVLKDQAVIGQFQVAVGTPDLPTPTGHFYITEKLHPKDKTGPYGVLAFSISAYQPKLSYWEGGGQVAIHGTNQPGLIGQAASHGCVRMRNKDILALAKLVKVGCPVTIVK